ncbi:MAG: acetamidase/formamidase family protein [Pyramidobacter sp.]
MSEDNIFLIDRYCDSIGGNCEMLGSLKDGESFVAITAPGCWGPMITPSIRSGHEVTCPIRIEGAEPGDSLALFIEEITVLSRYAASGTGQVYPERYARDPSLEARCPGCGRLFPETVLKGIGKDAVRCRYCGAIATPQSFENGYTVAYDPEASLAVTLPRSSAQDVARRTERGEIYKPPHSRQHLSTILAASDLEDLVIRARPMVGNIACSPAKSIPSSKNSGDLLDSLNRTGLYEPCEASDLTDGHMDINTVGQGCIVLSPVKITGAGVYIGDVHLTQGDGELAGHTIDVSARVKVKVKLLKGLTLDGPILIPSSTEVDSRFRPFSHEEYCTAESILKAEGAKLKTVRYPIQVVGTGSGINAGIESAVNRAAQATGLSRGEIKNLATVGGDVRIGRTTGSAFLTVSLTENTLQQMGILDLVKEQYRSSPKIQHQ